MEFLKINGGHGEGGGQIVRSAVALSCITGQAIHLENIRKNRKVPGLRPQHLLAIIILQKITDAKVTGAEIGSTELKFIPSDIKSQSLIEDVGTAGSISLILQVLIPVVAVSQRHLDLEIIGGTDVQWSPTLNYTIHVLRDAYLRMGIDFTVELCKRGYYPKGNGRVKIQIRPSNVKSVQFTKRETKNVKLVCSFSNIPKEKIEDKVGKIKTQLADAGFQVDTEIKSEVAVDSGASLLIYSIDENSIIGTDALYNKKTAEFDLVIERFIEGYSVDENLADMLVVPASLGAGKTVFGVRKITDHLEANLFVTSKITGCKYGIGKTSYGFEVIIQGTSDTGIKQ